MNSTSAEEWRKLNLEPFSDFYEVSNHGRVRSLDRVGRGGRAGRGIRGYRGRVMTNRPNRRGYINVVLRADPSGKMIGVHRLVALTFIPNPEGLPEVNHIDCDKTNNRVENLEWCSRVQNHLHGVANGLMTKPFIRKLSTETVKEIREKGKFATYPEMAAIYGVHHTTISRILHKHRRTSG